MKKTKFLVKPDERFSTLQERMRKMLKLSNGSSIFMYINMSFVPSPEEMIGELNSLFSVHGELKVHYSLQEAWG